MKLLHQGILLVLLPAILIAAIQLNAYSEFSLEHHLAMESGVLPAEHEESLQPLYFLSFASLAYVALVLAFFYFQVLKPLRELKAAFEEVSSGNFAVEMKGEGRDDEIGELARAFKRVSISCKIAMRDLGKKDVRLIR